MGIMKGYNMDDYLAVFIDAFLSVFCLAENPFANKIKSMERKSDWEKISDGFKKVIPF